MDGQYPIVIPDSALKQRPLAHRYPQHSQPLPLRRGLWALAAPHGTRIRRSSGAYQRTVTVRCDCGFVRHTMPECDWRSGKSTLGCRSCVARGLAPSNPLRDNDGVQRGPYGGRRQRAARTDEQMQRENTPWADDHEAQAFVAERPNGGTLEEVAQYFGLTRERIRQIEATALRKLRVRDHDGRALAGLLAGLREREFGPRSSGGLRGSALDWDELPTLGFDR